MITEVEYSKKWRMANRAQARNREDVDMVIMLRGLQGEFHPVYGKKNIYMKNE